MENVLNFQNKRFKDLELTHEIASNRYVILTANIN